MTKTWRIAPPLVLATTLHAMVLTGVVQWRGGDTGKADGRTQAQASSLSVRLASRAPAVPEPHQVAAQAAEATTAAPIQTTLAEPALEPASPLQVDAQPAAQPPQPPLPTLTTAAAAPETPVAQGPAGPADAASDRYHARRELSRPPKPLSPIDIVFPPGVPTPGRHKAVLAIYIDEMGHVRKVHTEGESLPLAFEDAARNAFLSAQFRAGELEGRAVKSYIHIEVVFDEQPEARGLAVSSLGQRTP